MNGTLVNSKWIFKKLYLINFWIMSLVDGATMTVWQDVNFEEVIVILFFHNETRLVKP